mmetsp:Transcript_124340/g.398145  ORF Transcript_124340/g.398145 Transcript_124340/m.398145 type:complete len:428 (-) Transcript_124340:89-1372(-)
MVAGDRVPQDRRRARRPLAGRRVGLGLVPQCLHTREEVVSVLVLRGICQRAVEHVEVLIARVGVSCEAVDRWEIVEEVVHLRPCSHMSRDIGLAAAHLAEEERARVLAPGNKAVDAIVDDLAGLRVAEHVVRLWEDTFVSSVVRTSVHQRDAPHLAFRERRIVGVAHLHVGLEIPNVGLERGNERQHLHVELIAHHDRERVGVVEALNDRLAPAEHRSSLVATVRRGRRACRCTAWQPPPSRSGSWREDVDTEFVSLQHEPLEAIAYQRASWQLVKPHYVQTRRDGLDPLQHGNPLLHILTAVWHSNALGAELLARFRIIQVAALDFDRRQSPLRRRGRRRRRRGRRRRTRRWRGRRGRRRLVSASLQRGREHKCRNGEEDRCPSTPHCTVLRDKLRRVYPLEPRWARAVPMCLLQRIPKTTTGHKW